MVRRGVKPNREVEEFLHHSPVAGMVDAVLLSEMRNLRIKDRAELVEAQRAAQRTAMQMSWQLHALVARQVGRL
jgi:hypothetical protein